MLRPTRLPYLLVCCAMALCLAIYSGLGQIKPEAIWQWMDIASEGGTTLLTLLWMVFILSCRPRGRVTTLLASGLGAISVGAFADWLDEFWKLPLDTGWNHWIEGLLMPGGMLVLTAGLYVWRQEQQILNEHLLRRERLFREHRAFDRITQLANADYLRREIAAEQLRRPDSCCALILLDIDRFQSIVRRYGQGEGDRVLQALSHLLLLNLRNDDLLCRYAGDRFAVLLPETRLSAAQAMAMELREAVARLACYSRGDERIELSARVVTAIADRSPEALLDALNAAIAAPAAHLSPQTA